MNDPQAAAVSCGHTSIHPDTLGLHYTLMARDENQSRGCRDEGGKQCSASGTTQTGNLPWWRGSLPCSSSRTQHVLLHPLQAPLRSTPAQGQPNEQPPAALPNTLSVPPSPVGLAVTPGHFYPSSKPHWREQGESAWILWNEIFVPSSSSTNLFVSVLLRTHFRLQG